jgi:hypothetical protein
MIVISRTKPIRLMVLVLLSASWLWAQSITDPIATPTISCRTNSFAPTETQYMSVRLAISHVHGDPPNARKSTEPPITM